MAFVLLPRSRSKPQGSVKAVPKQKSARVQHSADSGFGFAKPVFQPQTAALPTVPVIQAKLKVGEPNDEFEQEADRVAELRGNGGGSILPSAVARSRSPVGSLQRLYGNQAVLQMRNGPGNPPAPSVPLLVSQSGILQRKCACGNLATGGECSECSKKKRFGLQTKLKVNEPGDIYEQEADRIADQVMETPAHTAVSGAPPRIQRFSGQSNGQMDTAPASVDQALASTGRPLEPVLRQDMEERFGYDFSRVRVHSGAAAEQSARDVNAHAYTVGHDIVFGAGRLAPGTQAGQRLIAHELTHVVHQSGSDGIRLDQGDGKRGLSPDTAADVGGEGSRTGVITKTSDCVQRAPDVKSGYKLGDEGWSGLVQAAVEELDGDADGKVLKDILLAARSHKWLKLWALGLQARSQSPHGNYLYLFFLKLHDYSADTAAEYDRLLVQEGIAISSTSGHFQNLDYLDPCQGSVSFPAE
jgi:hypothetical protein